MKTCQGLVSRSFTPREIFRLSASKEMTYTSSVSPMATASEGCLMRLQLRSEICTIPSTPPMSTNTP